MKRTISLTSEEVGAAVHAYLEARGAIREGELIDYISALSATPFKRAEFRFTINSGTAVYPTRKIIPARY